MNLTFPKLRQMAVSVFEFNGELGYVVAYEIGEFDYHADFVENPSDYYLTYDSQGDIQLVDRGAMNQHIVEYAQDIVTEYKKAVAQGMNCLISN